MVSDCYRKLYEYPVGRPFVAIPGCYGLSTEMSTVGAFFYSVAAIFLTLESKPIKMREIKFRAWNTHSGGYAPPELISICGDGEVDFGGAAVTHFVIEQYTGYKTKDGIELYEGDHVEFKFAHKDNSLIRATGIITFEQGMFLVRTKTEDYSLNRVHGLRLFGNIHEGLTSHITNQKA